MAKREFVEVLIDDQVLLQSEDNTAGISISYKLEDAEDFTRKKSSEALSITVPATVENDQVGNTLHNPSVEDMTTGQLFRAARKASVVAAGVELLVGKGFQVSSAHNAVPVSYEYDLYGNNGDWIISLREATIYDFLKHISFTFTESAISESWAFDGRNENLPYVFAPVRYRDTMDSMDTEVENDAFTDAYMTPLYLKPSISVYWIIYWAFKSIGYRIQSAFFDTDYFRRLVLPWTWGNFLSAEGNRQDNLKFLAKSTERVQSTLRYDGYLDVKASNDNTDGGFDANGVYQYLPGSAEMKWTYLPAFNYQRIEATFFLQLDWEVYVPVNAEILVRVELFINGVPAPNGHREIIHQNTGNQFDFTKRDFWEDYFTFSVVAGDSISAKVYTKALGLAYCWTKIDVVGFSLSDIRIPIGGNIDFENYNAFKNYKVVDLIAGVVDSFNLLLGADSISKVVLCEPAHPYSLNESLQPTMVGYFNGDWLDWSVKQDLSKNSVVELFRDYEREVNMKFKDDSNDGILKVVQDRNTTILAAAKYVFPDRFKAEKRSIENRFFAPTMHGDVPQWQDITGVRPQLICIIPENISNTSNNESQNTFQPKLAYYKGVSQNVGGWRYKAGGIVNAYTSLPFMFAVNYHPGGEADPVLSYSDEKIGSRIGYGLFRRFFLQRFAIMRNGQYYRTYMKLNNYDVTNWFHREHKVCRGQRWELVEIVNYRPLTQEPVECYLRKWAPVTKVDFDSVYPSLQVNLKDQFDTKYFQLKCLVSDIPGPNGQ
ncbi:hypothetical protein SAMN05444266_101617 [Chitinophaga jiangningensis]|uniref:Uncharacterized protein n=1 Tax=Chitinophaga jiangningensis TaxID=1419482 RepID=A0A1M6WGI6_9BACT|nr:hypothetical protein [Chitinophaga jiangningensis]SHK92837.1 hypothetical protein SAMN05444266_101617 [Chitinophaga jiangningensis]